MQLGHSIFLVVGRVLCVKVVGATLSEGFLVRSSTVISVSDIITAHTSADNVPVAYGTNRVECGATR